MMRKPALVVLGTAAALLLYAATLQVGRHSTQPRSGSPMPDLVLSDLQGKTIRTSDYKDKVVVVNFWAAWCTPCAEEIPQFMALQKKYETQRVQVLGISIDDNDAELRSFYRKQNMNYPVISGDQKTTDAFGGLPGLPTTLIIGRDSRIHVRQVGLTNFQSLEQQVVDLLHE
jgi:peroxiredoxin